MADSDDDMPMPSPPSSTPAYNFPDNDSLPKGVKKEIITAGSGWERPKVLYEVLVNLTGKVGDTVFDSNESEGKPRMYVVGNGQPCKGLDAVFKEMKKGEKAKVTVDAVNAFGPEGWPDRNVPADSELTYEVELVGWNKVEDYSPKKTRGILVKTLFEGPKWEKPKDCDSVFLRYRGKVQNEDTYFVVEGTNEGSDPVKLTTSQIVPAGLKQAIKEMKKGSKAIITLDGEHAFGNEGIPDKCVPAGATVEYEVELTDIHTVKDVCNDGGVLCELLNKETSEWRKPKETSKCLISYSAAVAGDQPWTERQFEEVTNVEHVIGAFGSSITGGLERAITELVKGQSALVTVRADYAYGEAGYLDKVKPGESVQYKVELHSFEEVPSPFGMSAADKQAYSEKIKQTGNEFFKAGATQRALKRYEAALEPFDYHDGITDESEKKAAQEIKATCLLNIAACHKKRCDWKQMISKCNTVLQLPVGHAKARFRRAKAYAQLGRFQEAKADLDKLLLEDPHDKAVLSLSATVRKLQKAQDVRAKQVFGKMFKADKAKAAQSEATPETAASA